MPSIVILFIIITGHFSLTALPEIPQHLDQLKIFHYFADRNFCDGRIMLKFKEKLQLTAQQETAIEDLLLEFEEVSILKNARIKIQELKLTSQIKGKRVDREQVEKLIRDISEQKTDLMIAYIEYLFDLKEVLTTEQNERIMEINTIIKNKFKERFEKRYDHHTQKREPNDK